MGNKEGFALEKIDERFKKSAMNYSLICVVIVLFLSIVVSVKIADSEFNTNFELFETIEIEPVQIVYNHNEEISNSEVVIGVSGYEIKDGRIIVDIFGENKSDENISAESGIFILSSFNKLAAEPRHHYYAENWNDLSISAGSEFTYSLIYKVDDIENKINDGYIFTMSAFRNFMDRKTVEFVINI